MYVGKTIFFENKSKKKCDDIITNILSRVHMPMFDYLKHKNKKIGSET